MGLNIRKNKGKLFVVSAPSGAGKTTLCRKLTERRPEMVFSVSYTTRKPRPGEVDGRDYTFVGEEEFRSMVKRGAFAEWAVVHGNLYGTSRERLESMLNRGVDVLLDIDVQGGGQMREAYPGAVYIFILPPSISALIERLNGRESDSGEVIRERVRRAAEEISDYFRYDYVIVNDIFEKALGELESIVVTMGLSAEGVDSERVREIFLQEEEG